MRLFTASIASGSNGNCYYIGNENEAVLIDVGISCRETEKRMRALSLSLQKVKAVFISHEHIDHIKGVELLSARYQLPVYLTPRTLQHSRLRIDPTLVRVLAPYDPVQVGAIEITAFPKYHDAADPHSFIAGCNGLKVGVFTDIGEPCDHVVRHFSQCHAAFLEANYDDAMLEAGRYPYHLKKRISGSYGHLSNAQALQLFLDHRADTLQHLFLSHLSKDNNCPNLVHDLFTSHTSEVHITIASRYEPTRVFEIGAGKPVSAAPSVQASLF